MFKDKLKELRVNNNLTQEQLANKLFVTRNAISKWETGKGYPSLDTLNDIAKLFETTIDELINDSETKLMTINNANEVSKYQKIHKILFFIILFVIYSIIGIVLPAIVLSYDPTAVLAYFVFIRPFSVLLAALISAFVTNKKGYVIVSNALAIVPISIYSDYYYNIASYSFYEFICWILFSFIFILINIFLNHEFKYKTLQILKWLSISLTIILVLVFVIYNIVSLVLYNPFENSSPWFTNFLISFIYCLCPIIALILFSIYFHKKLGQFAK